MIDLTKLSSHYIVRELGEADVDKVLEVCQGNPQFYEYTEAEPTREQILADMKLTPPGISQSAKYYLGFFEGSELAAVMDLVDGYPEPDFAYIGFFMMNPRLQGRQIGSGIVDEAAAYLQAIGKKAIRLAIDQGNRQSSHFWEKNGFEVIFEADVNGWTKLVAQRHLPERIIAACGNDCSVCPRYTAHPYEKTEEELHHTAGLWMKIGYRDHVVTNQEISCTGCRPENWCRYRVAGCCEDRGIQTCAECSEFPCQNMAECFTVTQSFAPKCREVCTDEEYGLLRKAFFEKEKNLNNIRKYM